MSVHDLGHAVSLHVLALDYTQIKIEADMSVHDLGPVSFAHMCHWIVKVPTEA